MNLYDAPLFAVKPNQKTPAFKGWQQKATTDQARIQRWVEDGYNIGVRTGEGLLVVDIDVKDDVDGFDNFNEMADGRPFPETLSVVTPSGGLHIYLKYDAETYDIRNSTSKIAQGVDIRGEGGYVVAPGSSVDGEQYVPRDGLDADTEIARAPKWLLKVIQSQTVEGSDIEAGHRPMRSDELAVLKRLPPEYYERYDLWVDTGQALKYTFGEHGYMPWVEFSQQWDAFPGEPVLRQKWASFQTDLRPEHAIKFGSLVHAAGEAPEVDLEDTIDAIASTLDLHGSAAEFLREHVPHPVKRDLPFLEMTADGGMKAVQLTNIENIENVLDQMGLGARLNVLEKRAEFYFLKDSLQHDFAEYPYSQDIALVVWSIAQRAGLRAYNEWEDGVRVLASKHPWHPLEPYILSEDWDGRDHISQLARTVTLKDTNDFPVWRTYLMRWLLQGVQAVLGVEDPQQMRGCIVLQGPQGCGKTTWFSRLVPDPKKHYIEGCTLSQHGGSIDRDAVEKATSGFICELGELETTFSKAEAGALKNFLTSTVDRYRPAYGRTTISFPRGTIFCGTVNFKEFLRDASGSSRYWPVEIKKANFKHRKVDVAQVWAQARELWYEGEQIYLTKEEEKERHKRSRNFEEQTPIRQLAEAYFDHYGSEKDGIQDGKQIAVNATTFCKGIGVQVPKKIDINDAAAALTAITGEGPKFHRDGKHRVQKSWMVPHSTKMEVARGE